MSVLEERKRLTVNEDRIQREYDKEGLALERKIKAENKEKGVRWKARKERIVNNSRLYDAHVAAPKTPSIEKEYPSCYLRPGYYTFKGNPVKVVGINNYGLFYQVEIETAPDCISYRTFSHSSDWNRPEEITW